MTLRNIGMIALSIYLILVGLGPIFGLVVHSLILGILALLAGILILITTLRNTP